MEELQTVIINGAISILTVAFGVGVAAFKGWLDAKRLEIETKRGKEQLEVVDAVAKTSVGYVEQVFKDVNGSAKLMRALDAAQKALGDQGITISDEQLRVFIESAVKQANDKWKAE